MKIYSGGTLVLNVAVEDSSVRYRAIMGDHNLTLKFSLAEHVELPVGATVTYEGVVYTLKRPENLKMIHTRDFEYTVLFESPQADTKIWKFRNTVDGRLKFPMTARPLEHLTMLVANLNRRGSGWTVGDCITGAERLINYDHDYCWDALGKMADTFKTEFEIDNKRVSLKKIEYNKTSPLALSYGKGNGFRSGVTRQSEGNAPVEFLFVQGGARNIDRSKYGSSVLLLPKNQTYTYEGRTYQVDDKGLSIFRTDKSPSTYAEDSLSLEDIYPSRVGKVSEVIVVDSTKHLYDFTDSTLGTEALNLSEYLIAGEKMTVEFQSGQLAGHGEFEVTFFYAAIGAVGSANYKKPCRFEIVPKEEDGYLMPDATFKPAAGNDYIVLNISLPDAYIRNDNNQTGASWEMFKEACRYMYEHEDNECSFKGELDPLWAKSRWTNIGGKIRLGGYVSFTDARFQATAVLVRITGIKDYVNRPHKPEIELSNKPVTPSFSTEIKQLEGQEIDTYEKHRDALSFTKRRFRDAQETMSMLSDLLDAGFDNFTNNINPIAIQTMQLLVGDESLQFRFVNNKTTPATAAHNVTYNHTTKVLTAPAGIIQHMTLDIDTLSSSHDVSDYKFWDIDAFTSAALTDGSKKYYLYIRVSRTGTAGVFLLRETAINMKYGSTYYYLLYGILNSEYDGERSFVTLHGFTEILPGRVTTDRVISGDGNSFFDMLNNAMRLGNSAQNWGLDFNSQGDGKLRLKGTFIQSQSGDEQPVGVFRGWWNASYVYYYGDEVLYLTGGQIVTYRCISQDPISGSDKAPTNTIYWQPVARGVRGDFPSTCFIRLPAAAGTPQAPTGGSYESPIPTSTVTVNGTTYTWSDGIPSGEYQLWATTRTFKGDGTETSWSAPRKMTDTDTFDVEFAKKQTNDATPPEPTTENRHGGSGTQIWFDPVDDSSEDFTQMYWRSEREKKNGEWKSWVIVRIKGEKGNKGDDGNYYEYRYCVNGSTSSAPSINSGQRDPSVTTVGVTWSTSYPSSIGALQYLWMTMAKINGSTNALIGSWSTPIRQTPVDALQLGENLVNNSEEQESYSITASGNNAGSDGQFIQTKKYLCESLTLGATISAQVRIKLTGCSPKSGGGKVLVYMNGSNAWPTIGEKTGITSSNITLDLKHENFSYDNNGGSMFPQIYIRLNNFNAGGTVTISRVKVEYGSGCSAWSLSEDDKVVPATPFRGVYSSSKTYHGSVRSVDLVKYNGHYYVARTDAGSFSNQAPQITVSGSTVLNSDYWNDFGAEYESIATTLLLAELANIAGFIFRNNRLESQKMADGTTVSGATNALPMILLDGLTGLAKFAGGKIVFNADGSVSFANGKFVIDTNSNVTMNNVVANSGTFKGIINADGGIILPLTSSNNQNDYSPTNATAVHYNTFNTNGQNATVYLPSSPKTGQQVMIKFCGDRVVHKYVSGNGKYIYCDDGYSTKIELVGDYFYYDYPSLSQPVEGYKSVKYPSVTLVYTGSHWLVIATTTGAISAE